MGRDGAGTSQDTSALGGSHEGCISRWLAVLLTTSQPQKCLCRHPVAPKRGQGLLQEAPAPHLQPKLRSPEVPTALVTPIDLQPLLEAFSTQSISKDPSCGSKGNASSPSLAGPMSPHLFLEATRDKQLDHARACWWDLCAWGQSPVTTGRSQKHRDPGVPICSKSQVLKPRGWRGEERGGGIGGGWGGGGQVCH